MPERSLAPRSPRTPQRPQEARSGNIDKKLTNRSSFTMEKNRHPRHSRPKRQLLIESVQKHCVLRCIHVQGSHLSNGMTTFGPQNFPKEPQIDQNQLKSMRGRSNHRILQCFNVRAHATLERNDHLASQTRTRLEQKTSLLSKFDTRLVRNACDAHRGGIVTHTARTRRAGGSAPFHQKVSFWTPISLKMK